MSCQQASRFITTATTTVATAKSTATTTKRIVTTTTTAAAATTAKITKTTPAVAVVDIVDVENIGVAAAKTNTFEDPYVFTETVTATPPILFNAQKSRARLTEAQHSRNSNCNSNNNNNNSKQRVANKKSSIVAATTVAQASLGAAAAATTTTTNFNNVTQSQRQPASTQQSPLQLQSQASPKRATNVCVVRPQQQQQLQQQQQQQQQLLLKQQQAAKLITKHAAPQPQAQQSAPPPPLYTHTPSLWQTPLILDSTQKQQQQQPQQQQQQSQLQQPTSIVVATALVSPPISPASLPSPTVSNASTPTAAVTAMVSPIVLPHPAGAAAAASAAAMSPPKGGSLPPSKFHHTTLAQHFAKVECLKKKKSLPLACQNSNNNHNNNNITIVEMLHKTRTAFNLTHPPPLTVFNTTTAAASAVAAATTAMKTHSADAAVDDNSDLNEIPVNVIFRKPPELLAGQTPPRCSVDAKLALMKQLGAVAPLTPPTPSPLSAAAATSTTTNAPALITQLAAAAPPTAAPAAAVAIQNQTSSKVANSVAAAKRKTQAAVNCRKANKQIAKNAAQEQPPTSQTNSQVTAASPPVSTPATVPAPVPAPQLEPTRRRRVAAVASKRNAVLFSEHEPLEQNKPYCLQTRWLPADCSKHHREERIAMRKSLLRHQALQLLSVRTLQELPMRAARQRLQSVQSLLLKYRDTASQQQGIGIGNRCLVTACKQPTLSMAAHCERHIVHNTTQQLFQPCVAWRVDGSACQTPVFDVLHTLALCPAHSQLRPGLVLQSKQKQQQHQHEKVSNQQLSIPVAAGAAAVVNAAMASGKRKRKTNPNANPVGRPQKRVKKPETIAPTTTTITSIATTTLPMRKSSTTSLESIASNSQSSAKSHSALPPYTPTMAASVSVAMPQLSIIPPALAPLSDYQQQLLLPKLEPDEQHLDASVNLLANASFKADEISQIVAQLTAASSELHHNNNNNSLHYNNNNNNCSNNNSNSGSSSISCGFPSFNAAFGNAMSSAQQGGGQHSLHNTTLESTESLLSQHMFGICENSSAYASSEDTGLGGLSESELIGANDADDIALNGAHLLEEHDLVNVFDTLPEDAFNELFQSVQQAECEAMDRALEIADKNLKCLQQTIGGTDHDSAFLNDLLDVGDDLLVNAVSSIDAATLFVDSSSGGGNSSSNSSGPVVGSSPAATVADIRGLVQT
ncbi:GH18932 [Drosophila grimshawi]|uniref:GH18932 n=1 Tax=Drosophila grimshawi TaxID=7222 RepID=B4JH58_DROGR|nr:GH18932 [Drosophila grimshawi]